MSVDKLARDCRGDPASALPGDAGPASRISASRTTTWTFHSICRRYCSSATAEHAGIRLPPPLLDRMELIPLQGYTEEEKVQIANPVPDSAPRSRKTRITTEQIEFPEDAVGAVRGAPLHAGSAA